jgi:REP element-mobilizing transposase RayT
VIEHNVEGPHLDSRTAKRDVVVMGDFSSINWRSRGYLPHFDAPRMHQHIVFGLADASPAPAQAPKLTASERVRAYDAELDAGHGACLLRDPKCALIVQSELLQHDGSRYRLLAWCVMPNHVHVVIEQGADLAGTVRRWKSWTTRAINATLGRQGTLWRREYFDRFARNESHLSVMIAYVENNPVAAGLVAEAAEWPWSSAGCGRHIVAGQAPGGPQA